MRETWEWEPWVHHSDGRPDIGDYVRLRCTCLGIYHEAIYLGDTPEGDARFTPDFEVPFFVRLLLGPEGGMFCHWSRRRSGIENDEPMEIEKELEDA